MTHQPDREDLAACVAELLDADLLLPRVTLLLPQDTPGGYTDDKSKPRKQPVAPAPWNEHAAGFITDVHAGARDHERNLTLLVHRHARYRGGSSLHTAAALRALPDLIVLAADRYGARKLVVREAIRALERWPRQARAILDEARTHEVPWTAAPGRLKCPHCRRRLQLRPGWERDAHPELWCRACPVQLEDDEQPRTDRRWPASQWLGQLQEPAATA